MFLQLLPYDVCKIWESPVYEVSWVWSLWCQNGYALWSYNSWADLYRLQYLAKLINWLLLCFGEGLPLISDTFELKDSPVHYSRFYTLPVFSCVKLGEIQKEVYIVGVWSSLLLAIWWRSPGKLMVTFLTTGDEWLPLTFPLSSDEQKGKNITKTDIVWTISDKWDRSTSLG